IKEVQVLDALTVRFVLSRPSPMLLSNLTYTTTAIISPAAAAKIGPANLVRDATAAGTGPYQFKEWVRGTSILVTRNPGYWGKAPAFDEVMFRVVPDAGTRETKLLAGAGYPSGFEVTFFTPTGRYIQDFQVAQAVAAQLRNVGIRASVSTMEWPSYVAEITAPPERTRLQMFVLGWAWVVLDCDGVLFGQFHSSQHPPRGLAPAFYTNAEVDSWLDEARTTVDVEKRKTLYRQAQQRIWT